MWVKITSYSYYDPASEYWSGGSSGSLGCINEWPGLTPNDSAQTLEVITPLLRDEGTCVGNVRPKVSCRISDQKTCVGNVRPQAPVMLEQSLIGKRVRPEIVLQNKFRALETDDVDLDKLLKAFRIFNL